jgi:hypothetical protein
MRSPTPSEARDKMVRPRAFDWSSMYWGLRKDHQGGNDTWAIHNGYPRFVWYFHRLETTTDDVY